MIRSFRQSLTALLLIGTVGFVLWAGHWSVSAQTVDPLVFDAEADYRILTRYGSSTEIELSAYLAADVTDITFTLESCASSRTDYYSAASVENGKLVLQSNTLGHVHGTNTESETECTVTGTGTGGSEDRTFYLYTVSDRIPLQLPPGALSLTEARQGEIDIQIAASDSSFVRVAWRRAGSDIAFSVASDVSSETTLTIPDLEAGTEYEIRAYLMTAQSFDLYRAGNSGAAGTLIAEGSPAAKWQQNLSGAGLGKSQTIMASTRGAPALSIDDARELESVGSMTFDVTLNEAGSEVITVEWAASNGNAEAPGDYTTAAGTLTSRPGEALAQTVSVPIINDAVDEPDEETFTVTLSGAANADLTDATATGTIIDDDTRGVLVEPTALTFHEGESGEYTVVLTSQPTDTVTVTVTVSGDSDVTTDTASLTFLTSTWNMKQTVTVSGAEDEDAVDDLATVKHAVSGGDYGDNNVLADDVAVTVIDNEKVSTAITLSLNPETVPEGVGPGGEIITVTGRLDGDARNADTVVTLSVAGGTATVQTDFAPVSSFTLTILAGETSGTATFTLFPVDDDIVEDDETLSVSGSTTSGLTITPASLAVTIIDDDTRGVLVEPRALTFPEVSVTVLDNGTRRSPPTPIIQPPTAGDGPSPKPDSTSASMPAIQPYPTPPSVPETLMPKAAADGYRLAPLWILLLVLLLPILGRLALRRRTTRHPSRRT